MKKIGIDRLSEENNKHRQQLAEVWTHVPIDAWVSCRRAMAGTAFVYAVYLGHDDPKEYFSRETAQFHLEKEFNMSQRQANDVLNSAALTPGYRIYFRKLMRMMAEVETQDFLRHGTHEPQFKIGDKVAVHNSHGEMVNHGVVLSIRQDEQGQDFVRMATPFGPMEVPAMEVELLDVGNSPEEVGFDNAHGDFLTEDSPTPEGENQEADLLMEVADTLQHVQDKLLDLSQHEMQEADYLADEAGEKGKEEKSESPSFEAKEKESDEDKEKTATVRYDAIPLDASECLVGGMFPEEGNEYPKQPGKGPTPTPKTANRQAQRKVHLHYSHSGDLRRAIAVNRSDLSIVDVRQILSFYQDTGKIGYDDIQDLTEWFIGSVPRRLSADALGVADFEKSSMLGGGNMGIGQPAMYRGEEVLVMHMANNGFEAIVQKGDNQFMVDVVELTPTKKGPYSGFDREVSDR